jgi:predicted metal-dependent hydrolase
MAVKHIEVEGVGSVRFQKRRGTRSVRIHISGHEARVTLPSWVSYAQAIDFVKTRRDWIATHLHEKPILTHGMHIGKSHVIMVSHSDAAAVKTRVTNSEIRISLPHNVAVETSQAQTKITKACEHALAGQTTKLIVPRLHDLAYELGFQVNSIKVKKLQRRWGSCDHHKNITLNIYLAQLPWEYIDYVLIHELVHTEVFDHSTLFWTTFTRSLPNAQRVRRDMQNFHPQLLPK